MMVNIDFQWLTTKSLFNLCRVNDFFYDAVFSWFSDKINGYDQGHLVDLMWQV